MTVEELKAKAILAPPDDPIFKEGWVITLNPCVPADASAPEAMTSATPQEKPDGESEA